MLPSAELLPLSASPSLSQGQVGVTGTAGPAGARGWSVSHLVSLSPFGMIADGGGGHICDQEHRAGLKLVSAGFFLTPKQGSTGLRGPPGPQGLEGAKVRGGTMLLPVSFWALPKHCSPWLVGDARGTWVRPWHLEPRSPRPEACQEQSWERFPFFPRETQDPEAGMAPPVLLGWRYCWPGLVELGALRGFARALPFPAQAEAKGVVAP